MEMFFLSITLTVVTFQNENWLLLYMWEGSMLLYINHTRIKKNEYKGRGQSWIWLKLFIYRFGILKVSGINSSCVCVCVYVCVCVFGLPISTSNSQDIILEI